MINKNDIPKETIYRNKYNNAIDKINKLKQEVNELKHTLEIKRAAIRNFKAWQNEVCTRSYDYFLHEALEISRRKPNIDEIKKVHDVLSSSKGVKKLLNKIEKAYRLNISSIERFKTIEKDIILRDAKKYANEWNVDDGIKNIIIQTYITAYNNYNNLV